MAGSKEDLHDVPEASTEEQINNDADDDSQEQNNDESSNDQSKDVVEPKGEEEEIAEEIQVIDESLIGHVTTAKCCEDLNTKLFSNVDPLRDTVGAKSVYKRKSSIGSKRQSFRKNRESKTGESKSDDRKSRSGGAKEEFMGALMDRFQSFIEDTKKQMDQIDNKLSNLEAPNETEPIQEPEPTKEIEKEADS